MNQTEIKSTKAQIEHPFIAQIAEAQELEIQNLDKNLPRVRPEPLYTQILLGAVAFTILFHGTGALFINDYFQYEEFHTLSTITISATSVVLVLLSRYTHSVRNV